MSILDQMGIKIDKTETYRRMVLASILLDTSGSTKPYKSEIYSALMDMIHQLRKDAILRESVILQVVGYNKKIDQIIDFVRVKDIEPDLDINIEHHGKTHTGSAVLYTLNKIDSKKLELRNNGTHIFKPIVFLITDGNPDYSEKNKADEQVKLEEAYEKISSFDGNFFAIGIGQYCDADILDKLAGGSPNSHLMIEDVKDNLKPLFKLMTDTITQQTNGTDDISNEQFKRRLEEIKQQEAKYGDLFEEDEDGDNE